VLAAQESSRLRGGLVDAGWTLTDTDCGMGTYFRDIDAIAHYADSRWIIRPAAVNSFPQVLLSPMAAHECWPGHHLQIARQPDTPWWGWANASSEGWATYAETLPHEAGIPNTDGLGYLVFHLWRAVRAVVDTGIHARGWTRSQGRAYYYDNTPLPALWVEIELAAIFAQPAMRMSHWYGLQTYRALRDETENRLGNRFDVHAYHQFLLDLGRGTLPSLRKRVAAWEPQ
jgi:uncharacterized protein (DUF885 family)